MFIVGERINSSRKNIEPAVRKRDTDFIQREAIKQVEAGAHMLDVNAGSLVENEPDALRWLVETVQDVTDVPLCIDSPNPMALHAALAVHRGKPLINSITGEKERFAKVLPLVKEFDASIVALCMDDSGMPKTSEDALKIGTKLVEDLLNEGIPVEDIYVDPLVRPISTDGQSACAVLKTIENMIARFPGIHTICGLSNVSFGLPIRKILNRSFLVCTIMAGMDSVILDPLDSSMLSLILATEALLGKDKYCRKYVKSYRQGKLSDVFKS